jgi:hypothetical protein
MTTAAADAVSLNDVTDGLASESVSLADFAEEPGGAWPTGWYKAEVVEGFATAKSGKQYSTEDAVSSKGDSRNLRLCVKVSKSDGSERTMQETFNYRASDFTAERLAFVKEARAEYKDVRGRWADSDVQRSSLAIAKIGQFQKAIGFTQLKLANGGIAAGVFVGQALDVRVSVDENGYNVITAFAPAGSMTWPRKVAG